MIAVVHLVWGPLGPEPLRRFLRSVREHAAGAEHELVLLLNGVDGRARELLAPVLDGVPHSTLALDRPVQDLVAYAHAAARLEHEQLCFVNSYSEVRGNGWLAKLRDAHAPADVGVAGASGSWMSMRSLALNGLVLPNGYRGSLPPRRSVFAEMEGVFAELAETRRDAAAAAPPDGAPVPNRVRASVTNVLDTAEQLCRFPPFPAPHLRTNAFIIARDLFRSLGIAEASRKTDAHALESGWSGITATLRQRGLRAVVVDREGRTYAEERWPDSLTFWQGDQEQLLVSDNQTRVYATGGPERRRVLAALAWGPRARPPVSEPAAFVGMERT